MVEFEWDAEKNRVNLQKHGLSFEEAATVFGDPLSDTFDDPNHSFDEHRFLTIGTSGAGRLLIVSHTDREDSVRLISAREVTRDERKSYAQGNG